MGFRPRALAALLLVLSCCACSRQVRSHVDEPYPKKLSAWQLFVGRPSDLKPNAGVVPYDLNTPLFSDYATKYRFVWMPPATSAVYSENETFEFPVGAILSKTFAYPLADQGGKQRLIETRLLVRGRSGWATLPYVWNLEMTEAYLDVAADPTTVRWKHPSGESYTLDYVIPNVNQCKECHEKSKTTLPIGPKARNLNRDFTYADGRANQLDYWARIGYLKGAPVASQAPRVPAWDDASGASLEARARAYLDVNCAHCHNPEGTANTSGLYLTFAQTDPMRLGFCKVPVSAGLGSGRLLFDVVQGNPDESILMNRMDSATPKVMMPELGRTVIHREGVALIRQWIESLNGRCESKPSAM
jgi:uncharacterized repeat protein (TIGR03806 family)